MLAFKAIPKYRDNVYDPDPEKSYTKAKIQRHLGNEKENVADNLSISSSAKNPEILFPAEKWQMTFSTLTFQFFQILFRWMRFNISKLPESLLRSMIMLMLLRKIVEVDDVEDAEVEG